MVGWDDISTSGLAGYTSVTAFNEIHGLCSPIASVLRLRGVAGDGPSSERSLRGRAVRRPGDAPQPRAAQPGTARRRHTEETLPRYINTIDW